ncbi:MAG: Ig-like domain-containing protein, partial [Verrucomicrobiota bacterium]
MAPVGTADSITILPQKFKLTGQAARQQLIVEKLRDKQFIEQLTNGVNFQASDSKVIEIKNGVVLPIGNGTATITAKVGKNSTKTEVIVEGMEKPSEWSFRNHVQPVLAKTGCSSGACHGAAAGQNGFRLSLRGYDDDTDYLTLTRHALGRRVNLADPGRSMLLTKPTAAVPHKGGKKFEVDSIDYRVLSEWIASGAPGPKKEDPRIEKIEIIPDHVVLKPDANQQLLVRATFNDGHTEDVTHWVKYTAANATVTQVDDNGLVKVVGNGEGAITAWYLSRIAIATVTVPYTNKISSSVFAKARRRNFIDDLVLQKLASLNLPPSPRSTDAEFIRRIYLDTIGVLPT